MRRTRVAALLTAPLLLATGLILAAEPARAVVSNKLVNPGFEDGSLNGWQTWPASATDANSVEASTKYGSWKGVHRRSTAYEVYTYQSLTGLTNGTYIVSANFRSSGGQTSTNFTVKSGSATLVNTPVPAAATTDWARLQLAEVTISNGQLEVGVYSNSPADKWLYFDDVRVDYVAPNPAETTEGTNLVTNAGFESTTGWSSNGSAARVTDNANTGSASLKLGPTTGFTYQDITSGFRAGQTVVLTGYGKAGSQGGVALVGVQAFDASGTQLSDEKIPFFATTTYGKNSTTSVLPAGTAKLRVYAYKEDGDRSSPVYVDDVRLYVSNGTTYYVDPAGDNTRSGTSPAQAWATLDKANQRVWAPGDTLLLKGGSTFAGGLDFGSASSGTMNHPITVSSYGTGRAVVNATKQHGILLQDAGGFHLYNIDVTGPGVTKDAYNGIFATNQASSVQRGLVGIDNVTVSGFYLGINAMSRRGKGFGPINILNSTTRDNFREGTNVFGYNQAAGGGNWWDQGVFSRAYVGYVTSYNNQEWSGILLGNTDDAMIEHSTSYDIGETAKGGGGPVGIWLIGTRRGTMQFNSSSDVGSSNKQPADPPDTGDKLDGDGYDVSWNNSDALMQYNFAFDNEGPGFLVDNNKTASTDTTTMRYNVSHGNCRDNNHCGEFYNYGPTYNVNVYNNSLRATRTGKSAMRFAGEYNSKATHQGSVATTVRNNILSVVNGGLAVDITPVNEGGYPWGEAGDITFQGNLYWADGGNLAINDKGMTYNSLSAWQGTGREKNGTALTGLQADPLYANPNPTTLGSAADLKIGVNSPAKDAGLNLSSLFGVNPGAIDYFGTTLPQGAGFDIGAHER
ncbi:MAG TPA: hypothetical protein VE781_01070 [Kineosporiaceae bacterium]|jgi:hypothetical protein|nr:hypothetical protein [Kineosporiaceae bacterium]